MNKPATYDAAIVGGGLAGLTLALQLKKKGHRVILFEKDSYPFHRVCGEYISLESLPFLHELGVDIKSMQLPLIKKLQVSAPNGLLLEHELPMGGFGVSRYLLDHTLAGLVKAAGVDLRESDKVDDILYHEGSFFVYARSGEYRATLVAGCFGKRSNLDLKWARSFVQKKPGKLGNYIGVKYHIRYDFPADTIALHNFRDGYCGISRVEDGKCCLCYLTTAANLSRHHHSISLMQENVLAKNPFLKKIFSEAEFLFPDPVVISQVSFREKSSVENHVLMVGDSAGMITPLCGNGMSMAMHAGKIAAANMDAFLKGAISRHEMETRYADEWSQAFSARLRTGRTIQSLFGKPIATNLFLQTLKPFPALVSLLVSKTHGKPF